MEWRPAEIGSNDGYAAHHGGREFELVKLDRESAEAWRTSPGWHLAQHPDADPDDRHWIGPGLGSKIGPARVLAEAWIITPPADRQPADDAPNLLLALGGGGASFTQFRAPSGQLLVVLPDVRGRQLLVTEDTMRRELAIGTITPQFHLPEFPGVDEITVTWHPVLERAGELTACASWHDACRTFAQAADQR